MLATMPGTAVPSPKSGSFANLLAGFASSSRPVPEWKDDGLRDDIATISYEQALRTHTRMRPVTPSNAAAPQPAPEPVPAPAPPSAHSDPRFTPGGRKPPASVRISEWSPAEARNAALSANRKTASVTVRLNLSENEQLHERAAAAGLTASAYLRSCLFEAEALRTQVKEALEQFRNASAAPDAKPAMSDPAAEHAAQTRRSWLLSRWLGGDHAKSA